MCAVLFCKNIFINSILVYFQYIYTQKNRNAEHDIDPFMFGLLSWTFDLSSGAFKLIWKYCCWFAVWQCIDSDTAGRNSSSLHSTSLIPHLCFLLLHCLSLFFVALFLTIPYFLWIKQFLKECFSTAGTLLCFA